ncbi:MAG TPA: YcnI family protein [Actinomycetota bacterium]|nr:YcnI family protein [Actinomycetota bacterium]
MFKKVLAIAGALLIAATSPAAAHVTVQPNEAPAGAFFRFVVRVPNERDDADTTRVKVDFPDNLIFVSFQPKEGWNYEVKMKTLDEPIEAFGAQITEVVDTVTWSGGVIAPHEFDEFGFSARVPEEEGALEFAAFQTYSNGDVVEWTGDPESEEPAALVSVVDLGAEEGQGQLAVLAEVKEQVAAMDHGVAADDTENEDGSDLGLILGGVGTGLGAIALAVALRQGSLETK